MKKYNIFKKVIFSVSLVGVVSTNLFSEEINNQDYLKAVESFKNNSYKDSYIYLNKYLQTNSTNKNIAFMLGRSAYELGKYAEALSSYNLILMEEPSNTRVKLEVAQTYFAMGKYDEAKENFEDILKNDSLPPVVRKNVELTLASLNEKNKKNYLKTTLVFGFGYDSNIENYSNEYLDLSSDNEKTDRITDYTFVLNHNYKILNNLFLENKLIGYSQKYVEYDEKNIDLIVLGTAIAYYADEYKYTFGVDYNHIWLGGDDYLNNYSFYPMIQYKINKDLEYKTLIKISKKDFKQTDYEYKDSVLYEWQNSLILTTENYGINSFLVSVGTDNKDRGKHYNIDNDFFSLKYENAYPITNTLVFNNSIEYYRDLFKEESDIADYTRKKDDRYVFATGIIKAVNENLSLGANLTYTNNNSNQELFYSYDKYVIKSSLYYSF